MMPIDIGDYDLLLSLPILMLFLENPLQTCFTSYLGIP